MTTEKYFAPLIGPVWLRTVVLLYRSTLLFPVIAVSTTIATILVGLTEGVGLGLLLPILSLVGVAGGDSESKVSDMLAQTYSALSIPLNLFTVLLAFLLVGLIQIACSVIQKLLIVMVREKIQYALRVMLFDSAIDAKWSYLATERINYINNAIATETTRIISVVGYAITFGGTLVILGIYVGISYWISWQFTSMILGLGLVTWVTLIPLYRLSLTLGTNTYTKSNRMQEVMNESFAAGRTIRALDRQRLSKDMFHEAAAELMRNLMRNQFNAPLVNARVEPVALLVVVLIIYLGLEFTHLAPGEMVTLLVIFYRIFPRLVTMQERSQRIFAMLPSYDYLADLTSKLMNETERTDGVPLQKIEDRIELQGISVHIGAREILRDVSLTIPAHSTVALIGPSGGGKSTILDVMLGLRLPDSGSVLYDGRDLSAINLSSLRSQFGTVLQDAMLFHDSIRNNLLFAAPGATESEMWQALEQAHATEFVRQIPEGLDGVVGDRGVRMSGGQRQRLALAQALLRKPQILLLDEPTSALDQASEDAIRETLRSVKGKITVVVVSHRPTLTIDVDAIYNISDGRANPVTKMEAVSA